MVMSVWMLGCPRRRLAKPARRIGKPSKSKTGMLVINIITWKKSTSGCDSGVTQPKSSRA